METTPEQHEQKTFRIHWQRCPPKQCKVYIDEVTCEVLAPCGKIIGKYLHNKVAGSNGIVYDASYDNTDDQDGDGEIEKYLLTVDEYSIRPLEVMRNRFYRKQNGEGS